MTIDGFNLATALASWALTYLLHATLLLAVAALATLLLRDRPELEEAFWKLALVGGLLSASAAQVVSALGAPWARAAGLLAEPPAPTAAAILAPPSSPPLTDLPAVADGWHTWLVAAWAVVALLLLARLAVATLSLRRRLASRDEISSGPLARLVDRLRCAAGRRRRVRLTRTAAIPVPIALRAEVCLPERALRELPPGEQQTVVAHEMAHVLRRDPAWLLAGRVLGALLFFHPLVLLATRRLRRVAELRCDDWAAEATGRPLDLARCLTRVAGWHGEALPAAAMAGAPSWLAGRVTRLLDRHSGGARPAAPAWVRPVAAALLLAVALALPAVSLPGASPPPPEAPAAPQVPEVPAQATAPPAPAEAPEAPMSALAPQVPPRPKPAPSAAPAPVIAPASPVPPAAAPRPARAIPAPGPLPPAHLTELEAVVALEMAELEARLADAELLAQDALTEEDRRQAEAAVERERDRQRELQAWARLSAEERRELAERDRQTAEEARRSSLAERRQVEARRRQALRVLAEELAAERGRLAEDLAAERDRLAAELAAQRQRLAGELAEERQLLAEEARRIAEQVDARALDLEAERGEQREQARRMAEQAERLRAETRRERERLAPELERLRDELRRRTEQREALRRELEELRRELEAERRREGG